MNHRPIQVAVSLGCRGAGAALAAGSAGRAVPSDLSGRVLFSGLAVPGATVTATQATATVRPSRMPTGAFTVRPSKKVRGPSASTCAASSPPVRDVAVPLTEPPLSSPLTMRRYEEIVGSRRRPPGAGGRKRRLPRRTAPETVDVINGSVNNGAATPFAQSRAFGNNRPRSVPLYTGGIGAILGNSAWNARPYSFGGSARRRRPTATCSLDS